MGRIRMLGRLAVCAALVSAQDYDAKAKNIDNMSDYEKKVSPNYPFKKPKFQYRSVQAPARTRLQWDEVQHGNDKPWPYQFKQKDANGAYNDPESDWMTHYQNEDLKSFLYTQERQPRYDVFPMGLGKKYWPKPKKHTDHTKKRPKVVIKFKDLHEEDQQMWFHDMSTPDLEHTRGVASNPFDSITARHIDKWVIIEQFEDYLNPKYWSGEGGHAFTGFLRDGTYPQSGPYTADSPQYRKHPGVCSAKKGGEKAGSITCPCKTGDSSCICDANTGCSPHPEAGDAGIFSLVEAEAVFCQKEQIKPPSCEEISPKVYDKTHVKGNMKDGSDEECPPSDYCAYVKKEYCATCEGANCSSNCPATSGCKPTWWSDPIADEAYWYYRNTGVGTGVSTDTSTYATAPKKIVNPYAARRRALLLEDSELEIIHASGARNAILGYATDMATLPYRFFASFVNAAPEEEAHTMRRFLAEGQKTAAGAEIVQNKTCAHKFKRSGLAGWVILIGQLIMFTSFCMPMQYLSNLLVFGWFNFYTHFIGCFAQTPVSMQLFNFGSGYYNGPGDCMGCVCNKHLMFSGCSHCCSWYICPCINMCASGEQFSQYPLKITPFRANAPRTATLTYSMCKPCVETLCHSTASGTCICCGKGQCFFPCWTLCFGPCQWLSCFCGNFSSTGYGSSMADTIEYERRLDQGDAIYHRAIMRQLGAKDAADFSGWLPEKDEEVTEELFNSWSCLGKMLCCFEASSCCWFRVCFNHMLLGDGAGQNSVNENDAHRCANLYRDWATIHMFFIDGLVMICFFIQVCVWGELARLRNLGILPWSTSDTTQYGTYFYDIHGEKATGPMWANAFLFQGFMMLAYTTPAKLLRVWWGLIYKDHFMKGETDAKGCVQNWARYMFCRCIKMEREPDKIVEQPAKLLESARTIVRSTVLERLLNHATNEFAEARLDDYNEVEWKDYNAHLRERND